jgi:hypothetical protein
MMLIIFYHELFLINQSMISTTATTTTTTTTATIDDIDKGDTEYVAYGNNVLKLKNY